MISLWRHQWAVIRIRARNPGMWLLHCHMAQHIPTGMIAVLNVKPSLQPPIPPDVPSSGNCPVHGWNHTAPPGPTRATARMEIMNWVVDYQRPTHSGNTPASTRVNGNQIADDKRSSY